MTGFETLRSKWHDRCFILAFSKFKGHTIALLSDEFVHKSYLTFNSSQCEICIIASDSHGTCLQETGFYFLPL